MANKIRLDIVTPERIVFSEDVNMVIARATDGDVGILPGHAPMMSEWGFAGLSEDGGLGDHLLKALLGAHAGGKTVLIAEHRSVHLVRLLVETPAVRVLEMRDGKLAPRNGEGKREE